MKIDKEKLSALLALPDEELWLKISEIAKGYGFKLPKTPPPHSDMERIRSAGSGANPNLGEALKLINKYRKEQKNG